VQAGIGETTYYGLCKKYGGLIGSSWLRDDQIQGGVKTPEEEIETLRALRAAFPVVKLRYDPQAIYSPATSIRIGKKI
jgi:glucarate dehydratase